MKKPLTLKTPQKNIFSRRDFYKFFPALLAKASKKNPLTILLLKLDSFILQGESLTPFIWERLIDLAGAALSKNAPEGAIIGTWEHDTYSLLLPGYDEEAALALKDELKLEINKEIAAFGLDWANRDFFLLAAAESGPPAGYANLGKGAQKELQRLSGCFFPQFPQGIPQDDQLCDFLDALLSTNDAYLMRQGALAGEFAKAFASLLNLDQEVQKLIPTAARLEDIGMLLGAGNLIWRPGPLTMDQWRKMMDHPRLAADLAKKLGLPDSLVRGILYHHEHWDGSGYPSGLYGEQIPMEGRILAFSSLWAALLLHRPYRKALSRQEALGELHKSSGSILQPALLEIAEEISQNQTILILDEYRQF